MTQSHMFGNLHMVRDYIICVHPCERKGCLPSGEPSEQSRIIMSDSGSTHGPRRSQRERKQVTHFTSGPSYSILFSLYGTSLSTNSVSPVSFQKRKRDEVDSNTGDDEHVERHLSDLDDVPSPDENEQDDHGAQKPRGKPPGPTKKKTKSKAPKRTRVIKPGESREPSSRKSKKHQTNGDASIANKIPQDFKINTDNALFSAC
jgi:cohesin complex subunit SA-1/2